MKFLRSIIILFLSLSSLSGAVDPGKEQIGVLRVDLIFATNGDVSQAGKDARPLTETQLADIKKFKDLVFQNYRLVGGDEQPILRSYENWLAPLRPSQEILLSFEPRRRFDPDRLQLDLEYWQGKRKLLKTDPILRKGKPLYLLGPAWRGGKLIIMVQITELS